MNMNLNEMQNVWSSPRNNLPTEAHQRVADQFARQMIRRRRFQSIWLIQTFAALTVVTVLALWNITGGNVQSTQEWFLFPLLLVPWGFAIHFLRRYLKPVAPATRGETPIVDSLRTALASNQETRSHLKLVGVLYVIMIPLLALAMRQLHAVGKVSERELTSMAIFFGAVLLIGGIGIAARYFVRLQPQQKRLNALLAELADGPR
jgi:hypothetical protein